MKNYQSIAKIDKEKRFDVRWMGTIKEDGTEIVGHVVGSSKTLLGARKFARMNGYSDWEYIIEEIGWEDVAGYNIEDVIAEHRINPKQHTY